MHGDFRIGLVVACLAATLSTLASAFYIPGYSIRSYPENHTLPLFVNKVYSDNTQLQHAWYDLPHVCPPTGDQHGGLSSGSRVSLNLGEVLRGDRIVASDIDLELGRDRECTALCIRQLNREGVRQAAHLIANGYIAEWIVDNLPGATSFVTIDRSRKYYAAGFKLGYTEYPSWSSKPIHYLYNHWTLVLRWRLAPGRAGRRGDRVIVGFEVYPRSVSGGARNTTGCPRELRSAGNDDGMPLYIAPNNTLSALKWPGSSYLPEQDDLDDGATLAVPFSYSVYWAEETTVDWSSRWSLYFRQQDESTRIHWLAILISLMIAGLLTALVVMIWNRTVGSDAKLSRHDGPLEEGQAMLKKRSHRPRTSGTHSPREKHGGSGTPGLLDPLEGDDMSANSSDDELLLEDLTGWKLLHADVFRTPIHAGLLAPLIGSGAQFAFMMAGLLALSSVGVLNPSWRGGFVSAGMGLFIFAGVLAGYFSGRVYKTFGGLHWRQNMLLTALVVPGLLFGSIFFLNLVVWAQASSTALPFGTLIGLVCLWLLIQVPLVYAGSWWAHHRAVAWEHPTRTSALARPIPASAAPSHYSRDFVIAAGAGLVPFAVIFIELLFVFRSLWQDKSSYYYVFGFLTTVAAVNIVAIIEITIVATYAQLCMENYHWWWQSFAVGAGSSLWIFLYCSWYYFAKLHIQGFVSALLFFAYSFLACAVYGLMAGTIGFLAAYAFVRRIYGAVKVD